MTSSEKAKMRIAGWAIGSLTHFVRVLLYPTFDVFLQQRGAFMNLKDYVREFPDFPRKGILFKDISPILRAPRAMSYIVEEFYNHYKDKGIDLIVGVESRGLIFASILAIRFDIGFVMTRKLGKLPGKTRKLAYDIEYGDAVMEIQEDAVKPGQRILIIDDLLATGGTAKATAQLVESLGGKVEGFAFVIELKTLGGRAVLSNYEIETLVTYDN